MTKSEARQQASTLFDWAWGWTHNHEPWLHAGCGCPAVFVEVEGQPYQLEVRVRFAPESAGRTDPKMIYDGREFDDLFVSLPCCEEPDAQA